MIQGKLKTENEYRKLDKDSSSSLKEFSIDRRKYYKKYYLQESVEEEENKASTMGNLVELLLFEKDRFDEKFHMSTISSIPTGNMLKFVEALYKYNKVMDFSDAVKEAYRESEYKWSIERVLEHFTGKDPEIYFNEISTVRDNNLTVITASDVENAERIVEALKTNEFTKPIFDIVFGNDSRYEVLIQHKFDHYEIDDLALKSMTDLIIIDHKLKTIQVYDLKCTWAVENFTEEYYLYRRAYIQAYLYTEAVRTFKLIDKYQYYDILAPKFIVSDSINYYDPLVYTLTSDDLDDAYRGFEKKGRFYPGVKEIIKDLKFAKENDIWKITRKNYENQGEVSLWR